MDRIIKDPDLFGLYLAECSQCGANPKELAIEDQPEIYVMEYNFGDPYLYAVCCQICGRIATGVGREKAVARWNSGAHDLSIVDEILDGITEDNDHP